MKTFLVGASLLLMTAGAAFAQDFIVVNSSDPAIVKGHTFNAGDQVSIAAGKSVSAIRTSGEVVTFQGGANPVTIPGERTPESDQWRAGALASLVSPPPEGRTFGATRGFCPEPEEMLTLSIIVRADQAGCAEEARVAFANYVARAEEKTGDAVTAAEGKTP